MVRGEWEFEAYPNKTDLPNQNTDETKLYFAFCFCLLAVWGGSMDLGVLRG